MKKLPGVLALFLLLFISVPSLAQTRRDVRLTADTTTDYFEPLTPWMPSIQTNVGVQAYVYLMEKTGAFRVRLGIQTFDVNQALDAPVALTSQSSYITVVAPANGTLYRFDPNSSGDGDIDTSTMYRVGLLYSVSSTGAGAGTVRVEGLAYE